MKYATLADMLRVYFRHAMIATVAVFTLDLSIIFFAPQLFYFYPDLDIPFHLAGGYVATLWTLAILSFYTITSSHKHFLLLFCTGIFAISIGWEVFEYILDLIIRSEWYGGMLDTIGDLANDIIGATVSWYFLVKRKTLRD